MEEFDTSLTTNTANIDQPPSTAPKIKYEPLIIKKKEYSSSSDFYASNKSSNGQIKYAISLNFKLLCLCYKKYF
jgi:hypothetical protein